MEEDLTKAQLKWIAEKVDRMDTKLDRLAERFNLSLGKMLGASAVIAIVASIAIDLFCFHARAAYYPWGWRGWLQSVSTISNAPTGGVLTGSMVFAQDNGDLYYWSGSAWVIFTGGEAPGGSIGDVQYNNGSGGFAGSDNFITSSSGTGHIAIGPGSQIDNNAFFNTTPGSYLESLYQSVTSMPAGEDAVSIVAQTDLNSSSNISAQGIFSGCTNNAATTATGNTCIALRGNATSFAAVTTANMSGISGSATNNGTGTVTTLTGANGTASNVTGGGSVGTAIGSKSVVTNQVSGATFSNADAFSGSVTASTSSTITTANGLLLSFTNNGTSVGTYNGVNILSPIGTSTTSLVHGIDIADMGSSHITNGINLLSIASNASYNIEAAGTSPNYFQGNVGIGSTAPGSLLSVGSTQGFTVDGSGDVTLTGLLKVPVRTLGNSPTCAVAGDAGNVAITSTHIMCVCTGSVMVQVSDGTTLCTF